MPTFSPPVRIAFCITDLDAGGAERALVQVVTRLDRTAWEPFVFCLSGEGELAAVLRSQGVMTSCLGVRSPFDVRIVWRLARALRRLRPAILQTFLYHGNIVGRIAGKAARVPHIFAGIRVAEKRSRRRLWIDRATEWMVDKHVCVSQVVAAFSIARGGLSAAKIEVIPNGVDAAIFADASPADLSQFEIPVGSTTLIFVGRLDPQKGPFLLLAAVKELLPAHPELHVLMVGDGPLRPAINEWVRAQGLGHRIHLAGRRSDVPALMRAAQFFVLPSVWEGMPNVVLEAMAAGLPVIATNVEGVSDLIQTDETGVIVAGQSPSAISAGILGCLRDPVGARTMGGNAQHMVQTEFTWERIGRHYESLYRGRLS